MRFNLAAVDADATQRAAMHRAMLDMARFADRNGFFDVSLAEHHGTQLGWTPSPLPLAAALLGATERVRVGISALVLPLHDPIRIAEDVAAIDLAFGNRFGLICALGYRSEEYAAFGKDWAGRGALFDRCLETMLTAWRGEPFTYDGRPVHVTPTPVSQPHPAVFVGGASKAAARRAARFGLGLAPQDHLPKLQAFYESECAARGTIPMCLMPPPNLMTTHVSADPDRAWATYGRYFLAESTAYNAWQPAGSTSVVHSPATTVEELRADGPFQILTPADFAAQLREAGPSAYAFFHPLVGGLPIDEAWRSLELYINEVVPASR